MKSYFGVFLPNNVGEERTIEDMPIHYIVGENYVIEAGETQRKWKTSTDRIEKVINICWKNNEWNDKLFKKLSSKNDYINAERTLNTIAKRMEQLRESWKSSPLKN